MPELPEVETVVRQLRQRLIGRRFSRVHLGRQPLRVRWRRTWNRCLVGRKVAEVQRRGKWILIKLEEPSAHDALLAHLGMTGRLYVTGKTIPKAPHTHLVFSLDDGQEELRYQDPRRFGLVRYLHAEEFKEFESSQRLGPEPWEVTTASLCAALNRTNRCVKAVLLDQRVLAGVGNIYADEALFDAGLSPSRLGRELSAEEADRLRRSIIRVLNRAIQRHGSTILNFVYGEGNRGNYQKEFRVYGRRGLACLRCQELIVTCRLAGRTTHFCPGCQQ